jgi:acyl dehydratase
MKVGDVVAWERTFTDEDVRRFAEFSGDAGEHHLARIARRRAEDHAQRAQRAGGFDVGLDRAACLGARR